MPIIEAEVDIRSQQKGEAEVMLRDAIIGQLGQLTADQVVVLKLTLPETADLYRDLVGHPNILRVVALLGGYDRDTANCLLASNHGLIASFSRALTEGLLVEMSDDEFGKALDGSIASVYAASIA